MDDMYNMWGVVMQKASTKGERSHNWNGDTENREKGKPWYRVVTREMELDLVEKQHMKYIKGVTLQPVGSMLYIGELECVLKCLIEKKGRGCHSCLEWCHKQSRGQPQHERHDCIWIIYFDIILIVFMVCRNVLTSLFGQFDESIIRMTIKTINHIHWFQGVIIVQRCWSCIHKWVRIGIFILQAMHSCLLWVG